MSLAFAHLRLGRLLPRSIKQEKWGSTRRASGDGTVPYESLRFPLAWVGAEGTDIENHELLNLEHRTMLADTSFISYVIHSVCKKAPVELSTGSLEKVGTRLTRVDDSRPGSGRSAKTKSMPLSPSPPEGGKKGSALRKVQTSSVSATVTNGQGDSSRDRLSP